MKRIISALLSVCAAVCLAQINTAYVSAADNDAILGEQLDMPIVSITSDSNIYPKDDYVSATVSVYGEDGLPELEETEISIRTRGNSSLDAPKKSYRMKFDKKQNLLGVGDGKAKSWILTANYYDASLLRNMTAYELGNMLDGMPYTPNCKSVEVYLNGDYQGVYLLCEAVNVNKSRINIAENTDSVEDNGYLLEMTSYAEGDCFDVGTKRYEIKSDLSEDSEIKSEQIKYISDYTAKCLAAVKVGSREEIERLIDVDSLVDIYIANEIVKNADSGWDSFYMYKDSGGRLTFGPMWDFDIALGNYIGISSFDSWRGVNAFDTAEISQRGNPWFCEILDREWFRAMVTDRWNNKSDELFSLEGFVKKEAEGNRRSYERNFVKWNILGKRIFNEPDEIAELSSFSDHARYLSDWVKNRLSWLDTYFNSEDFEKGIFLDEEGEEISKFSNMVKYTISSMMCSYDFVSDSPSSFTISFGDNQNWTFFRDYMQGLILEKGQKYVVSFDCVSTGDTEITYKILRNRGVNPYVSGNVSVGGEPVHFETEFTSSVLDADAAFVIEGKGAVNSQLSVTNISLRRAETKELLGDLNRDGTVDKQDAEMLQKWLLNSGSIDNIENADLNNDDTINIFDCIIIKRMILEQV